MKVGIDHISFYVPKIALDINEFAQAKQVEADKLKLGLGLQFESAGNEQLMMMQQGLVDANGNPIPGAAQL